MEGTENFYPLIFLYIVSTLLNVYKLLQRPEAKTYNNKEYKRKIIYCFKTMIIVLFVSKLELSLYYYYFFTGQYLNTKTNKQKHKNFYEIILLNLIWRLIFKFKFDKLYIFCKQCIGKLGL